MQVMRLQFYHRRLSNQPCNRVEAPHLCFILFSGEGKLPVSGQTLWCFSRNNIPMGTQDRWNTWGSCCFSRSKGNRNRRDVAFPAFKKNKRWILKALDRNTRRTVAWVVGGRDAATFRKLYCKLEHLNDCHFYTDDWDAFAKVLPPERHVIGKKHTIAVEQDNSNTRHHLGRMTRRTKIVSQSEEMISLSMRLWHALTTPEIFTEYQSEFISIYKWTLSVILLSISILL